MNGYKIVLLKAIFMLYRLPESERVCSGICIYRKHTQRITSGKREKHCPFSFFDAKGWIVMAFMIGMGVTIRKAHLLPESFIAVFYTGLSLALIATGGRFIRLFWKRKRNH